MALATFVDLPTEIVETIAAHAASDFTPADTCAARLACRALYVNLDAAFYAVFALNAALLDGPRALWNVDTLVERAAKWVKHATTVRVWRSAGASSRQKKKGRTGEWYDGTEETMAAVMQLLNMLSRVETVQWEINAADPAWLQDALRWHVNCHWQNTLTTLDIRFHSFPLNQPLPDLSYVTNLHTLRFRGSALGRQPVGPARVLPGSSTEVARLLAGLLQQNPHLTVLEVRLEPETAVHGVGAEDFSPELWRGINDDVLCRLTELHSNVPAWLLGKWGPGLQPLALRVLVLRETRPWDTDVFLFNLLPGLPYTLVDLEVSSVYESRWSVGRNWDDMAVLENWKMAALERLTVSVNAANVLPGNHGNMDVIPLLLRIAADAKSFRSLRTLAIRCSYPKDMRYSTCGPQRAEHAAGMRSAIRHSLEEFGASAVDCLPEIWEWDVYSENVVVELLRGEGESASGAEDAHRDVWYLLPRHFERI
ncbi:hypothetical protein MIND_00199800 [Mycena indigotica]|uniref:F-box domain-containing protein n=1 Tax=Mycena indigotica TaxID=2126181 RepID=A0A8H6T6D0_9AGAR|nr:uncharacterized protein MIND_00199800 [Mycena indigotica]KAF7311888.1 hypothetical protein MIND_00199800 [Mycena indigotica]